MEDRAEEARTYRRREREAFAAFEGNRYHIDRQCGLLITDVAAAAKGDVQTRERVETFLPHLEAENKPLATAIKRIWAGERDWHSLAKDLDRESALLVLRVLEVYAGGASPTDWAAAQLNLGGAHLYLSEGGRQKNLNDAIACYHRALDVFQSLHRDYDVQSVHKNLAIAQKELQNLGRD